MTDDRKRRERQFEALLIAYDDAALSGRAEEFADQLPADLADRLREARKCVDDLHALWNSVDSTIGTEGSPSNGHDSPALPTAAGQMIGRFQIERELGQGGAGIVLLVTDPKLRRQLALKVPRPETLMSPGARERFVREAEVTARLSHPHIVAVHEVGETGPICYIAAEYCAGPSLAAWLRGRAAPVPSADAAKLVADLAAAVAHAHARGVLHRDLKPSNILLKPRASDEAIRGDAGELPAYVAKVADFGLAKILEHDGDETRTGTVLGTPQYMAPEQAEGRVRDIGVHTDVYALGAILYELLVRLPPHAGNTMSDTLRHILLDEPTAPRKHRPEVSRDLEAICLKCLEKNPARRYASAGALESDLRRYLAGEPTRARPLSAAGRLGKWARRRPAVAALAAVLVVALLTIFVGSIAYNASLQTALTETTHQREVAEASDHRSRQLLYTADMGRAHEAWNNGYAGELLAILLQHQPRAGRPDLREFSWYYLRGLCDQQVLTMRGHEGDVFSVDASPDGRFWATGGIDHTVRLWEAASGQSRGVWRGHTDEVMSVAFAPDGKTLASASEDQTVRLWSVPDGAAIGVLAGHADHVLCLAYSDDGRWLASGSRDGTVRVWDPVNRKSIVSLAASKNPIESVDFSRSCSLLVAGDGHDGTVFSWKTDAWQPLPNAQYHGAGVEHMLALAHAPQRDWMAGGGRENIVFLWEVTDAGLRLIHELLEGHYERIQSVAFSPAGDTLASADNRGHIQLWDLESFAQKRKILGHPSRVWSVAWSPDGERLASAGADGTARVWDPQAPADVARAYPPLPRASWITFSPDGKYLLASCDKNGVHWFDTRTHTSTRQDLSYSDDQPRLCVSPDGKLVAARLSEDGTTKLRVTGESKDRFVIPGGGHLFGPLCFSPDGKWLATTKDWPTAVIVDVNSGDVVHRFSGSPVSDLAFSPDGRQFARAGERLHIYDTRTMKVVVDLDPASHVYYSKDSRILIARLRSEVRAYEARTGRLLQKVVFDATEFALALHPDGKTIAVSLDRPARIVLWDVRTGQELFALHPPGPVVSNLLFSPSGDRLVATGEAETGQDHIWEWAVSRDAH